jgi:hypothetical protein
MITRMYNVHYILNVPVQNRVQRTILSLVTTLGPRRLFSFHLLGQYLASQVIPGFNPPPPLPITKTFQHKILLPAPLPQYLLQDIYDTTLYVCTTVPLRSYYCSYYIDWALAHAGHSYAQSGKMRPPPTSCLGGTLPHTSSLIRSRDVASPGGR